MRGTLEQKSTSEMTDAEIRELVASIARKVAQEVVQETVNQVVRVSVKEAVTEASKEVMESTFLALGLDIRQPLEIQRDMQTIRSWRLSKEKVVSHGVMVSMGILITALAAIIWSAISQGKP